MHVWNLIFYPKEKVNSEVALLPRSSRKSFCLKRIPRIADAAEDQQELKISVFVVEQYFNFCLADANIFYIMDRGAIVAEDRISGLKDDIVRQHLTV
jgi:ABC-type branched-subunit amino acid transport system ATPase component